VADLSYLEKRQLERLLGMGSGYVLNFSNRTFEEFIFDSVAKNVYDAQYDNGSGSKANRLRALWKVEPNHVVGKLLVDLVELAKEHAQPDEADLLEGCRRTAQRLLQSAPVPEINAIVPNSPEKDFEILARSVKAAIDNNEPDAGLDRLHTFVTKYLRTLCGQRGIATGKDKPLHSLMGEYVKALKQATLIESEMTERILKSSISLLDAFNGVRNEQSLAHDNPVLNYEESLLIFNQVTSTVRFISAMERKATTTKDTSPDVDDLPF
jgi:hypothetical protein